VKDEFMSILLPQKDIIYGPVSSRRLGRSLGINISSTHKKICSFDCVYCQYGRTGAYNLKELPSIDEVITKVEKALSVHPELDYITFSGNGEPTMHPNFKEIAEGVRKLRDRLLPNIPIALLTNSSFITEKRIQEALEFIDYPIFKLDAGDEQTFKSINRPLTNVSIEQIIDTLADFDSTVTQTLFVDGNYQNSKGNSLQRWLEAISRIKPNEVQIYSIDRKPAEEEVKICPRSVLNSIAEIVKNELGIKIKVY